MINAFRVPIAVGVNVIVKVALDCGAIEDGGLVATDAFYASNSNSS
jgi:hypothetical protein